jgi:hypothetical protein
VAESAWWRCWEPGQEAELEAAAIAEVRAHPRFDDALQHSLEGALRLSDIDADFHRLMVDNSAVLLAAVALYLDATGGLTHRRLRDLVGIKGILSGGRISALLLRMQMIGYLRAAPHAPGGQKVYRPSERMAAAFKARIRLELESVVIMAPDLAYALERYDEPDGLAAFMGILGKYAVDAAKRPRVELLGFLEIANRRAGGSTMNALVVAAAEEAGHFPAAGPVRVSISALARRFRVSRAHILKLLRQAEACCYFTRGDAEGHGVVHPSLADAFAIYLAGCYVGFAVCAELAARDMRKAAAA